jgi:hypothetical protein
MSSLGSDDSVSLLSEGVADAKTPAMEKENRLTCQQRWQEGGQYKFRPARRDEGISLKT